MELKNPYDASVGIGGKTLNDSNVASPLKKARWYFGTGLNKVDEIRYTLTYVILRFNTYSFIFIWKCYIILVKKNFELQ